MAVEPRAVIAPFLAIVRTDSRKFSSIADSIVRLHPVVLTSEELGRIHGVDERISMQNYARMIAFYRHVLSASARGAVEEAHLRIRLGNASGKVSSTGSGQATI
jgi:hypothetical protein